MSNNVLDLNVQKREDTGKSFARYIRRDGKVPGVFYISGEEAVPLILDAQQVRTLLARKPTLISLQMEGGDAREAIIREIQRDPVSDEILHIDFLGIKRGVKITATVPIELTGEPEGAKEGGVAEQLLRELEIEVLPRNIPDRIRIDISELQIGDSIHVRDLDYEEFEILTPADSGVVNVVIPRMVIETEEIEAAEAEAEAAEAEAEEAAEGEEGKPAPEESDETE